MNPSSDVERLVPTVPIFVLLPQLAYDPTMCSAWRRIRRGCHEPWSRRSPAALARLRFLDRLDQLRAPARGVGRACGAAILAEVDPVVDLPGSASRLAAVRCPPGFQAGVGVPQPIVGAEVPGGGGGAARQRAGGDPP